MQPISATFDYREDLGLPIEEFDNVMNEAGYVGHKLFPITPRKFKSGKVVRIPLEQRLQEVDTKRNPAGGFNRIKHEFSDDNYDTASHGLESVLDDETQKRYEDLVDAETFEGSCLESSILRNFEKEQVDFVTTEANYDGTRVHTYSAAGLGGAWSDRVNAVPIDDIDLVRELFFLDLGQEPNALAINRKTFRDLINNAQIVNRSKNQNFQDVRPEAMMANLIALASALDLDQIIVANSVKGVAQGGARSLTRIWPNNRAVLCRVAVTDNPWEICWGRTMMWSPFGAIGAEGRMGVLAESYDEPQTASNVQRRRANWGRKVTNVQGGRLLKIAA